MNYKTIYRAVLLFSLIAAVISAAFMGLSLLKNADSDGLDVFSSESVEYFDFISWLFIICAAAYLIAIFVFGKRIRKAVDFGSKPSRIAYGGMGITLTFVALYSFYREYSAKYGSGKPTKNIYVLFESVDDVTKLSPLYLAFTVALWGSVLFFCFAAIQKGKAEGDAFAALSMLPSIALAIKIVYDFLLQNNDSYGAFYNYHLLGLGFALLYSVNETRFYFKKAAPALYVFFGLLAAFCNTVFGLPALVISLSGNVGTNWHPAFCLADIVIAAYIYIRLFCLDFKKTADSANGGEIIPMFDENSAAEDGTAKE